jgi:glycosyltransferase involved in cell wall biosynthesis
MIKLSIVIPFYSTPDSDRTLMITQLLKSIPDRTDVEVIVVDDLSVPSMSLDFVFKNAKLVTTKTPYKSKFAGAARNHGLSLVSGMFVLNADSDDCFDKKNLDTFIEQLPIENDLCKVYVLGVSDFDDNTNLPVSGTLYPHVFENIKHRDSSLSLSMWHAPWAKVFPSHFLEKGVRFKKNDIVDDFTFSAKLALEAESVSSFKKVCYWVRKNHDGGQLTEKFDIDTISSRVSSYREVNTLFEESGRADLVIPLHHVFRRYIKIAPLYITKQMFLSLVKREKILPYFRK